MMADALKSLPTAYYRGEHLGITSVCSAHPVVIEAALQLALETGKPALIEATCNQVNQDGGYTGMTPLDFRHFVEGIARKVGLDPSDIILGGDHLGPNPWKGLPASQAMAKAEVMIAAFVEAGFSKLHLDTSMGCAGEPVALADEETARRAAQLAVIAERHKGAVDPVYVIGTEVPVPGGATHALDHLELTQPAAVEKTLVRSSRSLLGLRSGGCPRPGHRAGRPARGGIRSHGCRSLRSGKGKVPFSHVAGFSAARIRSSFDRLSDSRWLAGPCCNGLLDPQGRTLAHVCASRGAVQA